MLYAAFNPRRLAWKFGFSNHIVARVDSLDSILFASCEGDRDDERAIHRALDSHALGNELFRDCVEVFDFVAWMKRDPHSALEWARAHPVAAVPLHIREAQRHRRHTLATNTGSR